MPVLSNSWVYSCSHERHVKLKDVRENQSVYRSRRDSVWDRAIGKSGSERKRWGKWNLEDQFEQGERLSLKHIKVKPFLHKDRQSHIGCSQGK